MSFCAICTSDIASHTPRQAPLGRGNALVNVCDDCHDEPAREVNGTRAYEPPYSAGTMKNAIGPKVSLKPPTPTHAQRDGWRTVLIGRRDPSGAPRDQAAARVLVGHAQAHHVATNAQWFVFQVPVPRVPEVGGELDAIEQWRDA